MKRAWVGGALLACIGLLALVSLVWTPVAEPLRLNIANRLTPPGPPYLFGTDQLGRDVASLIMIGSRNALAISLLAVLLGAVAGTAIGLTAAIRGGSAGGLLMRLMDILFAFPPVLSAMLLALTLGAGPAGAVLAIALFITPVFARLIRTGARSVLTSEHVLAARALGASRPRIVLRHVLPALYGLLAVQVSIQFGLAILTEAGLSFLGLGTPPPAPSWGRMLADSQTYLTLAPWLALAPGLIIALTVLGANLLGDGLEKRLDPRARKAS